MFYYLWHICVFQSVSFISFFVVSLTHHWILLSSAARLLTWRCAGARALARALTNTAHWRHTRGWERHCRSCHRHRWDRKAILGLSHHHRWLHLTSTAGRTAWRIALLGSTARLATTKANHWWNRFVFVWKRGRNGNIKACFKFRNFCCRNNVS